MLYFVLISIFYQEILFIKLYNLYKGEKKEFCFLVYKRFFQGFHGVQRSTDSFKNLIYKLLETKYFLLSDKIVIKDIKKKLTNVLKKVFQLNKNRKTLHLDKLIFSI